MSLAAGLTMLTALGVVPVPTALGAVPVPTSPPDTGAVTRVVTGRVLSQETGAPLSHALVEVSSAGFYRAAAADGRGRYRLEGVPAGLRTVRASALDHAPLEIRVLVPSRGSVSVDLDLPLRPVSLPDLTATTIRRPGEGTEAAEAAGARRPARGEAELRALEATPGAAELGLAAAARKRDGSATPDTSSLLYVRGAAADLKLVLLDGAPVYAPFHLGGLTDAFHPDVLASSRLFLGGAPARYDGGLSHILDLRTRAGRADRTGLAGSLDFLGAHGRVEGPVGPARYLVSARGLHGGGYPALTGAGLPYGYADVLARLDVPAGREGALSATGFWNRESVSMEEAANLPGPARWGNAAGSLRYRGRAGGGVLEATAALGAFFTRLPVGGDSLRMAEGETRRLRFVVDHARSVGEGRLFSGLSIDRHDLRLLAEGPGAGGPLGTLDEGGGWKLGVHSEYAWPASADVELRAGLRVDWFDAVGEARTGPRAAATWHLSREADLSLSVGRFHQYVRSPETILSSDLDGPGPLELERIAGDGSADPTAAGLEVAGATHVTVGLQNRLRPDLDLGLEGYFKDFGALPAEPRGLRASGVDFWLHRTGAEWQAWFGYSLGFVWSGSATSATSDTARFAGRHLISAGLEAPLAGGLRLATRVAYGAGLPLTALPVTDRTEALGPDLAGLRDGATEAAPRQPPALAGAPDGSYLRLDAKLSRSWNAHLQGSEVRITPYVRLLNALDRRDALFYQFDPERDLRPRSLGAIPLLPLVGLEWNL